MVRKLLSSQQKASLSGDEVRATFVIIPAYNEATVLRGTVEDVLRTGAHVVVVDDCSSDDTATCLRGLAVTVLRHSANFGQGAALQTGIEYALQKKARYLVTFDADGQHTSDDIAPLLRALIDDERDIVLGSRFIGEAIGMTRARKLLLAVALVFVKLTTRLHLSDPQNGLRAIRAEAMGALTITQNRMAHASEMLRHIREARLSYAEVPCVVRYTDYSRKKGQSALGSVDILFELFIRRLRP